MRALRWGADNVESLLRDPQAVDEFRTHPLTLGARSDNPQPKSTKQHSVSLVLILHKRQCACQSGLGGNGSW